MLNLKLARIKKKLSQSGLAELIGIKEYSISRYETGLQYPTIETLLKLSRTLDVSVDYLLGIEKEK